MGTYSLDVVKVGQILAPRYECYMLDADPGWEPLNFYVGVLRGEGRNILINTGFAPDPAELNDYWTSWSPKAGITDLVPTVEAIAKVGLKPGDVDAIFFTPLTAYTTGSLHLFPRANFYMSKKGWTDFWVPEPDCQRLPRNIYFPPPSRHYLACEAFDRVRLLNDEAGEIFPGFRAWFAGGHHRSSMAYIVETAKGSVGWCDGVFKYPNIEKKLMLGITESMAETLVSYDRLRKEAKIVIPPYDPEVLERFPGGHIA